MKHPLALAALTAALTLSACNQNKEPEVVGGPYDPLANQVANAPPPPPLPIITANHRYRCSGNNEVVQVDWLELDGKPVQANLRVGNAAVPVVFTASADGSGPYSAPDGATLAGTKDSQSVTYTPAGASALTCRR